MQVQRAKTEKRPANAPQDCWNHIGVGGAGSCSELSKVGHCRNCSVYADAGAEFLDRPQADDYRKDWTDLLRQKKEVQQSTEASVVIFQLGDEWLALPTTIMREVAEFRPIHRIPHRTGRVLQGIVNIRGEIQLCISLSGLLGVESAGEQAVLSRRMLVVENGAEVWVFPVDKIMGTHRIDAGSMANPPSTVERATNRFTRGMIRVDNLQVGCLDDETIFAALKREIV